MATRTKRDLFGGALRCAGLIGIGAITESAIAGLSPMSQYAYLYGEDTNGSWSYDFAYTFTGPGSLAFSYGGVTANTYWDHNQLLTGASVSDFDPGMWNFIGIHVATQFILNETRQVRLEWNLQGASGGNIKTTSYFGTYFFELTNSDLELDPVGSIVLTLEGGDYYNFIINLGVNTENTGLAYIRFVEVPAPGALALVGISMIGMRRRRRTMERTITRCQNAAAK